MLGGGREREIGGKKGAQKCGFLLLSLGKAGDSCTQLAEMMMVEGRS